MCGRQTHFHRNQQPEKPFTLLFGRQKQSQKWYIVVSFSYYYGSRIENAIPYNFMVRPSIILFELCIIINPVEYL